MIPALTTDAAVRAAALLTPAQRVLVFTGSGMSRESGIPTFRDARDGIWARYDPADLATPEAFARAPRRVFGWYVARWRRARAATPHAGYAALARLEARFRRLVVVTQNVDGLHRRVGSRDVVELHGSLEAFRCSGADRHAYDADRLRGLPPDVDGGVEPPRCDDCGALIRPGVVWFGEMLPPDSVERAWQEAAEADVVLVIGTSGLVFPAAEVPRVARQHGARIVEINPDPTPLSAVADVWWPAAAGVALPALAAAVRGEGAEAA